MANEGGHLQTEFRCETQGDTLQALSPQVAKSLRWNPVGFLLSIHLLQVAVQLGAVAVTKMTCCPLQTSWLREG